MTLPTTDKDRKQDWPLWTFMFEYFPKAWLEVVRVAVEGNKQHNPGQPLHWARWKSTDQLNTAFRHLFDYGTGVKQDTDGVHHLAKAIWRLMAQLQLDVEAKDEVEACGAAAPVEQAWAPYTAEQWRRCACKKLLLHDIEQEFVTKDDVSHAAGMCTPGGTRCPKCRHMRSLQVLKFPEVLCTRCNVAFTVEKPT
jgi:hypothetical protein